MGIGEHIIGYHRDMADKGVCEGVTGNNCGIWSGGGGRIYKLCPGVYRMYGSSIFLTWWYQENGANQMERELY